MTIKLQIQDFTSLNYYEIYIDNINDINSSNYTNIDFQYENDEDILSLENQNDRENESDNNSNLNSETNSNKKEEQQENLIDEESDNFIDKDIKTLEKGIEEYKKQIEKLEDEKTIIINKVLDLEKQFTNSTSTLDIANLEKQIENYGSELQNIQVSQETNIALSKTLKSINLTNSSIKYNTIQNKIEGLHTNIDSIKYRNIKDKIIKLSTILNKIEYNQISSKEADIVDIVEINHKYKEKEKEKEEKEKEKEELTIENERIQKELNDIQFNIYQNLTYDELYQDIKSDSAYKDDNEQINEYNNQIDVNIHKQKQLEKRREELEKDNDSLRANIQNIEKDIIEKQKEKQDATLKIDESNEKLQNDIEKIINAFRNELNNLDSSSNNLQNVDSYSKTNNLDDSFENNSNIYEFYNTVIDGYEENRLTLLNNKNKDETLDNLNKIFNLNKEILKILSANDSDKVLENLNKEIQSLENQKLLTKEIESIDQKIEELVKEKNTIIDNNLTIELLEECNNQIELLQKQIKLVKEIDKEIEELEKGEIEAKKNIYNVKEGKEYEIIDAELQEINKKNEELKLNIQDLQKQQLEAFKEKKNIEFQENIKQKKEDLEKNKSKINEKDQLIIALTKEISSLEKNLEDNLLRENKINDQSTQFEKLKLELISELEKENINNDARITNLTNHLNELVKYNEKIKFNIEEIEKIKRTIELNKSKIQELQEEKKDQRSENQLAFLDQSNFVGSSYSNSKQDSLKSKVSSPRNSTDLLNSEELLQRKSSDLSKSNLSELPRNSKVSSPRNSTDLLNSEELLQRKSSDLSELKEPSEENLLSKKQSQEKSLQSEIQSEKALSETAGSEIQLDKKSELSKAKSEKALSETAISKEKSIIRPRSKSLPNLNQQELKTTSETAESEIQSEKSELLEKAISKEELQKFNESNLESDKKESQEFNEFSLKLDLENRSEKEFESSEKVKSEKVKSEKVESELQLAKELESSEKATTIRSRSESSSNLSQEKVKTETESKQLDTESKLSETVISKEKSVIRPRSASLPNLNGLELKTKSTIRPRSEFSPNRNTDELYNLTNNSINNSRSNSDRPISIANQRSNDAENQYNLLNFTGFDDIQELNYKSLKEQDDGISIIINDKFSGAKTDDMQFSKVTDKNGEIAVIIAKYGNYKGIIIAKPDIDIKLKLNKIDIEIQNGMLKVDWNNVKRENIPFDEETIKVMNIATEATKKYEELRNKVEFKDNQIKFKNNDNDNININNVISKLNDLEKLSQESTKIFIELANKKAVPNNTELNTELNDNKSKETSTTKSDTIVNVDPSQNSGNSIEQQITNYDIFSKNSESKQNSIDNTSIISEFLDSSKRRLNFQPVTLNTNKNLFKRRRLTFQPVTSNISTNLFKRRFTVQPITSNISTNLSAIKTFKSNTKPKESNYNQSYTKPNITSTNVLNDSYTKELNDYYLKDSSLDSSFYLGEKIKINEKKDKNTRNGIITNINNELDKLIESNPNNRVLECSKKLLKEEEELNQKELNFDDTIIPDKGFYINIQLNNEENQQRLITQAFREIIKEDLNKEILEVNKKLNKPEFLSYFKSKNKKEEIKDRVQDELLILERKLAILQELNDDTLYDKILNDNYQTEKFTDFLSQEIIKEKALQKLKDELYEKNKLQENIIKNNLDKKNQENELQENVIKNNLDKKNQEINILLTQIGLLIDKTNDYIDLKDLKKNKKNIYDIIVDNTLSKLNKAAESLIQIQDKQNQIKGSNWYHKELSKSNQSQSYKSQSFKRSFKPQSFKRSL
ncbi:MAG: hypothetical protein U1E31_00450 [Rickettsiales bacterium]